MFVHYIHAVTVEAREECQTLWDWSTDVVSYLVLLGNWPWVLEDQPVFSGCPLSIFLAHFQYLCGSVKLLYLVFSDYFLSSRTLCAFPSSRLFVFWGSVSLCHPGWPRIYCVSRVVPELGLEACHHTCLSHCLLILRMDMFVCVRQGSQRPTICCLLTSLSTLCFETVSHWTWRLRIWLGCLTSDLSALAYLYLPSTGVITVLLLVWQSLYWLSHTLRPLSFLLFIYFLIRQDLPVYPRLIFI